MRVCASSGNEARRVRTKEGICEAIRLLGRLSVVAIMSCAFSLGVAQVAQAATAPVTAATSMPVPPSGNGNSLLITGQQVTLVPSAVPNAVDSAALLASWNMKLPALKAGLANGESLAAALAQAGLPAIEGRFVRSPATKGGIQPDGFSCQAFTCGWQFGAMDSFEIAWLVWAGAISGPAAICLFFGAETAGIACTVAGAIWGVVSAYTYPPSYTGRCLYAGIGLGTTAFWERC